MSVNLQTACSRMTNVWRYSIKREQELKAQYFYYMSFIKFSERKRRVNDCEARASCWKSLVGSEANGSNIPAAFLFSANVCFLLFHVLVQPCILSIFLYDKIGGGNEHVFLPVVYSLQRYAFFSEVQNKSSFFYHLEIPFKPQLK